MEQEADFNQQLFAALDERERWINSTVLPKLDENYHMHLTCITNLFQVLEKKSLIVPDPYKNDKKISSIVAPEGTDFPESDRASVLGSRLNDYEAMVDFVCTYVKFSSDMKIDTLSKLLTLNRTILWNSFTPTCPKANTRNLAALTNMAKTGAPQLTVSLINENIGIAAQTSGDIEEGLKTVISFRKESYKADVRKKVLLCSNFNSAALQSPNQMQAEIRRLFPSQMQKIPYSAELINELIQEEIGADKVALRAKLLSSMRIVADVKKKRKTEVDTHSMIMDAVRTLGTLCEQYEPIIAKEKENHEVMESGKNSFFDKLVRLFRKMFNMEDVPVDYEVTLVDSTTNAKRKEVIHFNKFISELGKRTAYYAAMATKNSPGYAKINSQSDEVVFDFVSKQLTENNKVMALLTALDEYFKNNADKTARSKIKGIKMELSMVKNILQKANQQRADYSSYVEEKAQMKKLGISEE